MFSHWPALCPVVALRPASNAQDRGKQLSDDSGVGAAFGRQEINSENLRTKCWSPFNFQDLFMCRHLLHDNTHDICDLI